jgi:hypothetical protein
MNILENRKGMVHVQFESLHDLGTYMQSVDTTGVRKQLILEHDNASLSYEDTITAAINGGYRPASSKADLGIDDVLPDTYIDIPQPVASEYGYRPNVPAYLAGEPNCMYRQAMLPERSTVLSLGVHIGRTWKVSEENAANRGSTVLSIVDALQHAGTNVELWACWRNHTATGRHAVYIDILIKDSDMAWDRDSMALALVDTSIQRRLCWMLCHEFEHAKPVADDNYGGGIVAKHDEFDLWVPYQLSRKVDDWNPANRAETARSILKGTYTGN